MLKFDKSVCYKFVQLSWPVFWVKNAGMFHQFVFFKSIIKTFQNLCTNFLFNSINFIAYSLYFYIGIF